MEDPTRYPSTPIEVIEDARRSWRSLLQDKDNVPLRGRRIKFAGQLEIFTDLRRVERQAKRLGATVDSKNVTKKLWALVRGTTLPRVQKKMAAEYGIAVLSEAEFIEKAVYLAAVYRSLRERKPKKRPLEEFSQQYSDASTPPKRLRDNLAATANASTMTSRGNDAEVSFHLYNHFHRYKPEVDHNVLSRFVERLLPGLHETFDEYLRPPDVPQPPADPQTPATSSSSSSSSGSSDSEDEEPAASPVSQLQAEPQPPSTPQPPASSHSPPSPR